MPGNFKVGWASKVVQLIKIEVTADALDNYGSQWHNTPCSNMEV
jgi:hypothetical protein